MRCILQFGEVVKEVQIDGKHILSELRIKTVQLFGIDITQYQFTKNGDIVYESFSNTEDDQLFIVTHKSTRYVDRINEVQSRAKHIVEEKKSVIQSEEFKQLVKQTGKKSVNMIAKALAGALKQLENTELEKYENMTDSGDKLMKMFLLERYTVKPEQIQKNATKFASWGQQKLQKFE
ncbi:Hypothetical_protein [Hexamita inflata]|uniref:Hypothetical_protein n=1 Tax=Hexamita inflata TaxID=28002 RepID=A0AA86N7N5_9EUKA|nr:Hypothetical protein HINF_LOCUS2008 [Hexamita inflata]